MQLNRSKAARGLSTIFLVAGYLSLSPVSAFSQESFFKGKTIAIIQGRDPGGTGDLRVRALVPFLQNIFPAIRPW